MDVLDGWSRAQHWQENRVPLMDMDMVKVLMVVETVAFRTHLAVFLGKHDLGLFFYFYFYFYFRERERERERGAKGKTVFVRVFYGIL